MTVPLKRRLINVEEYHRMIEVGILTEDDRVELLNGEIIEMSPIGSKHAACVNRVSNLLMKLLFDKAIVSVQNPILTNDLSEPEPDITVLKLKDDFYSDKHPSGEDIHLIIEVADSSVIIDREVKLPLYAASNIPEYWIVNLEKKEIEVHKNPDGSIYKLRELMQTGDTIHFKTFDLKIKVSNLLG